MGKNRSENLKQCEGPPASFRLKPDGYPAANGSSTGAELRKNLAVVRVGLQVQKVSRIEHSFCAQRQPEARQFLSNLDAQRRVVNCEAAGKGIDGENSCIR